MPKDLLCDKCQKFSVVLCFQEDRWVCRSCKDKGASGPYFKEVGVENPHDKQGSTAHVRDIKDRRLDPQTKRMFYHQAPKTYFFPKG